MIHQLNQLFSKLDDNCSLSADVSHARKYISNDKKREREREGGGLPTSLSISFHIQIIWQVEEKIPAILSVELTFLSQTQREKAHVQDQLNKY